MYKYHRAKHATPIRPFVEGEDTSDIRIESGVDFEVGGYVAINPNCPSDKWYIAPQEYADNWSALQNAGDYLEHVEVVEPEFKPAPRRRRKRVKVASLEQEPS